MEVELIFQIAGIGIIVSVMNVLLTRSGRDEQALMITIAGLVIVLAMVVSKIAQLFETIKTVFGI
ncbi:MAG: stage III sporulation protein AC [Clostridia bacterium]|nr:stage III sporulation protein AC [Clostridia bacterium]MBQ6937191.1 stage III sporulation protein AC [Clostridia bacterium]MBR2884979.1 stage III sporulation protein AC [Clostridia bacterium]